MINMDKQYRTECGYEVRIYAVDGGGDWCIHGAILTNEGWRVFSWTRSGKITADKDHRYDLIEVKPRIQREYWVNVYDDCMGDLYRTKENADNSASVNRIACVKITIDCEEGEGL